MKITLKALRVNAGLSQKEVARQLKISRKTVQNWEANVTFPNGVVLNKICSLYGCEINDIFLPSELAKS